MTARSFWFHIHRVKRGNINSRSNHRRCCGRFDAQKQRKKKLEAAKDDPEEYARILGETEEEENWWEEKAE